MSSYKNPGENDTIIKSEGHRILLFDNQNDKTKMINKDKIAVFYYRVTLLLQSSILPRRRDNIFNSTGNASTFLTSANAEKDEFENEFDWQFKNENNIHTIHREIKENLFTTSLGENAKVKKEISQNGIVTKIYQGCIINARVDAIVSAANERLENCSGVAEVIAKAAGSEMEIDCRTRMGQWLKVEVSGNIITCAEIDLDH